MIIKAFKYISAITGIYITGVLPRFFFCLRLKRTYVYDYNDVETLREGDPEAEHTAVRIRSCGSIASTKTQRCNIYELYYDRHRRRFRFRQVYIYK